MRDWEAIDIAGVALASERQGPVGFAGLVLDLDACMLSRDTGETVPLTRGEMALLRFFASHPGRVLSRDTLLDATAGRRFEPFDRSIDVMVGRLRRKIEPDPKAPRLIVTVQGGYQFAAALRKARPPASPELTEPAVNAATPAPAVPASPEKPGPSRLSIVVLPFANMSGDATQEHFIDGVTESLTTDLSRISGAFVIGRGTAFSYKRKALDHRQIGRDLNVRYVLEGSVQRGGGCMRVNVQLIEAGTGAHLWAERFDKPVANLFDMQDEIVARLANQLQAELIAAEARRAERSPHPDSMDHYFLALAAFNRGLTAANLNSTRVHCDRALEIDPANVDALILRGFVDLNDALSWLTDDRLSLLRSAEAYLVTALRSKPDDARAHSAFGAVCMVTNRVDRGISECERALAIDRNHAHAHYWIGMAKYVLGRNDETEAHVLEAFRLSPRDKYAGVWIGVVGFAKLGAGGDKEAIDWFGRSIEANPNLSISHFLLAAALARLGRLREAHHAVRAGLQLNPSFTIARFRSQTACDNPVYLAGRERMYEGLRLAGLAEK
jgi:TolB-like protein